MATLPHESGKQFEPPPNQLFSIHVPDLVWIVQSGKLDLFLVHSANGEPVGARHHFLRVEQGRAVFGMSSGGRAESVIVAAATPGTQLLCLARDSLLTLPRIFHSGDTSDPLFLLEEWILGLGAAAASATPPPKSFTDLESSAVLDVPGQPIPIMPIKGVLWVEHLRGASLFLGTSEIDSSGGGIYFPVSRYGWLLPAPGSRICSMDSRDWEKADQDWRGLQSFHNVILQRLVLNRQNLEDKYRRRLLREAESDAAIMGGALRSLASPLQEEGSRQPADSAGLTDPTVLACEAVGTSLGVKIVPPIEMRSSVPLKDSVASIARASSLRYRVVVLKGKWWLAASGPLLAFREIDNCPMALLPAPKKGYFLYDPVERRTVPVTGKVALSLNGFAYSFYRPLPSGKLSFWDLLSFGMRDVKPEMLTIIAMGLCGGLLGLVFPIATGIVIDSIIPGAQRGQLLQLFGFLVVTAIAAAMFALTRNFAMLRLQGKIGASLQAAVWDRLLRLPVPFFRRYTSGDLADRSLCVEYILRALTDSAIYSIVSGAFSIFSFVLLFYYSWPLALIATGLVVLIFAASGVSAYLQVHCQRQIFRARGHISGMLLEFIGNIARLRVAGAEPRAFAAWAREFSAQKELSMRAQKVSNALDIFNSAFPVISLAVIFGYATQFMGRPLLHAFTTGALLAFLVAFGQFQSAALELTSAVESALGVVPLYERAAPIFETLPEIADANTHPGELSGSIEINHVNFRYSSDMPLVLRDVSFTVKPGQFVAVVGPSGSGKSSLLRLLLGFEKPESGSIYYDRQDLTGLDVEAVRRQIGVVLQSARLSSGSIFENIVGSAPLTIDDAWEAARQAGLERDIREMPMDMHTLISEGGGNLSGGQRQRLLIARAIVKRPRIFLFDEATSALDNRTQAIISQSLEAFRATRIVIAHRLSTIVHANIILVVEKGVVVQCGSYDELASQDGLFRELAKRQLT